MKKWNRKNTNVWLWQGSGRLWVRIPTEDFSDLILKHSIRQSDFYSPRRCNRFPTPNLQTGRYTEPPTLTWLSIAANYLHHRLHWKGQGLASELLLRLTSASNVSTLELCFAHRESAWARGPRWHVCLVLQYVRFPTCNFWLAIVLLTLFAQGQQIR